MPTPAPMTNEDGSLRPYTDLEVAAMLPRIRGVRDGTSEVETRTRDGSTMTWKRWCKWEKRYDFLFHMLGATKTYADASGGGSPVDRISRLLPQTHPDLDEFAVVGLQSMTGHKWGEPGDPGDPGADPPVPPTDPTWLTDDGKLAVYQKAECVFVLQHLPFALKADGDTSFEYERYWYELPSQTTTEYLSLVGSVINYVRQDESGNPAGARPHLVPIPYNVGFPVPCSVVRRKWCRVPYDAWRPGSALFNRVFGDAEAGTAPYLGTVNSSRFQGYPQGTLLLTGVEEQLSLEQTGVGKTWDLTFSWLYKNNGHNWFYWAPPSLGAGGVGPSENPGWFFAGRGNVHYTSDVLPDDYALFNSREFKNLVNVDPVEV